MRQIKTLRVNKIKELTEDTTDMNAYVSNNRIEKYVKQTVRV